jgi:signal recognition particle receptor subunit beta
MDVPTIHAKVIIIGPSKSGKTTLVDSIIASDLKKKGTVSVRGKRSIPHTISQYGSIQNWHEKHNGRSLRLHLYDISGHDFLSPLLPFVTTSNTLIVVTLSLERLHADAIHACASLESLSVPVATVPLIVAATNRDRSPLSDEEIQENLKHVCRQIRKIHNNIVKVVVVDSVTAFGLRSLSQMILQTAADLSWSQRSIPFRYKILIDRLKSLLYRDTCGTILESDLESHAKVCAMDDQSAFLSYVTQTGQFLQVRTQNVDSIYIWT